MASRTGAMGSKVINEDRGFPKSIFLYLLVIQAVCCCFVYSEKVECGQRERSLLGLITQGTNTREGDWPWHGAIYRRKFSVFSEAYICGGTVISEYFILTAAHCTIPTFLEADMFYVKLGLHNRSSPSENTRVHEVVEVIRHSDFDERTHHNDIALLRLENDIEYSDYIQPICLWPVQRAEDDEVISSSGTVVGWGTGDFSKKTGMEILQYATLSVIDYATCLASNEKHFKKYLSKDKSQFCAGNKNMTNVCDGDSGGGIYFRLGSSWYIRGLVSNGVKSDEDNRCDPSQYAIFSNIPFYLKWISNHQEKAKQRNLLNLGNCGLDSHNMTVKESEKPLFLQYPWTAMLEFQVLGTPYVKTMCNGALIHQRYVLTVGHCVGETSMQLKL
ncbi:chymotrypsin-like protease CTRL-1 [Uranotaenia lowii]|uniref:chymotrypsin-like protease CTRL-1 n=1 Tax=Uranotaenia lowii TaxID=190385 RepID=UPI00247A040B|nr:chymotrypsin-like protease CTRL-1 [Uranotaenia lowii]